MEKSFSHRQPSHGNGIRFLAAVRLVFVKFAVQPRGFRLASGFTVCCHWRKCLRRGPLLVQLRLPRLLPLVGTPAESLPVAPGFGHALPVGREDPTEFLLRLGRSVNPVVSDHVQKLRREDVALTRPPVLRRPPAAPGGISKVADHQPVVTDQQRHGLTRSHAEQHILGEAGVALGPRRPVTRRARGSPLPLQVEGHPPDEVPIASGLPEMDGGGATNREEMKPRLACLR